MRQRGSLGFLLDNVWENGQKVGYEVMIPLNLTHQDMANLVATSRQTVTEVLSTLKNKVSSTAAASKS